MRMTLFEKNMKVGNLPSKGDIVAWFDRMNPFEDEGLYASDIHDAYLVGSRAKGTHRPDSDYDIALEFNPEAIRATGKTAIQLSEILHQRHGYDMPMIGGVSVDIQIFEAGGMEQAKYSKIPLKA
jgi:predicted nucleotidyltransferase